MGDMADWYKDHEIESDDNRLYWTTQDGRALLPEQFDDGHLINTIRFIERNAFEWRQEEVADCLGVECALQGEMASYYAARDTLAVLNMTVGEWLNDSRPIYYELCREAARRGLAITPEYPDTDLQ